MRMSLYWNYRVRWVLLVVLCMGALGGAGYALWYVPAVTSENVLLPERVSFEVRPGESVRIIAQHLQDAGIVRSAWLLELYLKMTGRAVSVQAGEFLFGGALSTAEVAELLQHGGSHQVVVTIPEGFTLAQIDARLVELHLSAPKAFLLRATSSEVTGLPDMVAQRPVASLEGYLFPSTYFVDPKNFQLDDLIRRMVAPLPEHVLEAGYVAGGARSLAEVLTMASMVQSEERNSAEQPKVADILWRRLESGWNLGVDATLLYALGHKDTLTAKDLAMNTPYNTRTHKGLPPTPIGAVGMAALTAALHPVANEYWYYLHDATGAIHYAKTLAEHESNKKKYLGG